MCGQGWHGPSGCEATAAILSPTQALGEGEDGARFQPQRNKTASSLGQSRNKHR